MVISILDVTLVLIEVILIENKTSSSNIVNSKLPDSTGKKKMKKRNNKDDQRENSEILSESWPKSSKYFEKINTEKESNSASLS